MKRDEILKPGSYTALLFQLAAIPNSKVSTSAKLIWSMILSHYGENAWSWPSVTTLAKETGLNEDTVSIQIKKLQKVGLLWISRKSGCSHRFEIPSDFAEVISRLINPPKGPVGNPPKGPGSEESEPPERSGDHPPKDPGIPPEKSGDHPPKASAGTNKEEPIKRTNKVERINSLPSQIAVTFPLLRDGQEGTEATDGASAPEGADGHDTPSLNRGKAATRSTIELSDGHHADISQTSTYINGVGGQEDMVTEGQLDRAKFLLNELGCVEYFPEAIASLIRFWDQRNQHLQQKDIKKLASLFKSGSRLVRDAQGQLFSLPQLFEARKKTEGQPIPRFRFILSPKLRTKELLEGDKVAAAATELLLAGWVELGRTHTSDPELLYPAVSAVLRLQPLFGNQIADLIGEIGESQWLLEQGWFTPPWLLKRNKEEPDKFNYEVVLTGRYRQSKPRSQLSTLHLGDPEDAKLYREQIKRNHNF